MRDKARSWPLWTMISSAPWAISLLLMVLVNSIVANDDIVVVPLSLCLLILVAGPLITGYVGWRSLRPWFAAVQWGFWLRATLFVYVVNIIAFCLLFCAIAVFTGTLIDGEDPSDNRTAYLDTWLWIALISAACFAIGAAAGALSAQGHAEALPLTARAARHWVLASAIGTALNWSASALLLFAVIFIGRESAGWESALWLVVTNLLFPVGNGPCSLAVGLLVMRHLRKVAPAELPPTHNQPNIEMSPEHL